MASKIVNSGSYLPKETLNNTFFTSRLDTSDEWITSRTGIVSRHIATEQTTTSVMGTFACMKAIEGFIAVGAIDCIICATSTPDTTFPSTAAHIANRLNASNVSIMFDVNGACSGFVYGMLIANSIMAQLPAIKNTIVVGAEHMTRLLDYTDRSTAILFGDGAGALLLQKSPKKLILGSNFGANGSLTDLLKTNGGVSTTGSAGHITMNGSEVYKLAIKSCVDAIKTSLSDANMTVEDIDFFILHQANIRILNKVSESLNIDKSKMLTTIQIHGNTSAASIPLCLDYYRKLGYIKPNDMLSLCAIGAGMSWGNIIVRYDDDAGIPK